MIKRRMLALLCALPMVALWGCQSPAPASTVVRQSSNELTEQQREAFARIFAAYRGVLLARKQQCLPGNPCEVPITLQMVTVTLDDGKTKDFCVATLPESIDFPGTAPGNPDRAITWKLDRSVVGGMPVEFHEDHGILKIEDANGQLKPDNKRTDKVTFKGVNKHKVKNSQSTYVPVIIRYNNGLPEICGTADPKIINT